MEKQIKDHLAAGRETQLIGFVHGLFDNKTLLYIGGGPRLQMLNLFIDKNFEIDMVEAYLPNVEKLKKIKGVQSVFHSDIMLFDSQKNYDIVMFWHGVEHLEKDQFPEFLSRIKKYTNKIIILATPFGVYEQSDIYGNPFEIHKSSWYPEDFEKFGFKTSTIGKKDVKGSNLLAWMIL